MSARQNPHSFETFQQSRMSPNDRVYLNAARARLTTKAIATAGGTYALIWGLQRLKRGPKARKWPWALGTSLIVTVPALMFQTREEYRRAIIDLEDDSYLRKYLFDAAIITNPDLNAQQIYSKIAIEEYEQQQRNTMADTGQLPYNQPRKQVPPPQRW